MPRNQQPVTTVRSRIPAASGDRPLADQGPEDADAELFDPHRWPFFWITQAVGRYLQRLETGLKRGDLDISRWRVLMCLHPNRPTSVSEIAELAIVKLPTMTKIVQRMQADGLVMLRPRSSEPCQSAAPLSWARRRVSALSRVSRGPV